MENNPGFIKEDFSLLNSKIRNIEEKERIIKDQIFLLNQNLLELKDSTSLRILDLKKELEKLKEEVKSISQFLEIISSEFSKFAKKEDIEILYRHAKMFNPLELVTKKELERYFQEEKIKKEGSPNLNIKK
jgi:archaellum component FlaC